MVTVLRPLSTSELLDRTFHLYRNNFLMFVGIVAIPQLAVLALQLGNSAMLAARFLIGVGVGTVLIWLVSFIAIEASHAGTVMAVSDLHLDRATGIRAAYVSAMPTLLRVLGISFIFIFVPGLIAGLVAGIIGVAIAVPLAFLFRGGIGINNVMMIRLISVAAILLVPLVALRWWLAWALAVPVTVVERIGIRASLRRSKSLTKGSKGKIFLICFLLLVLTWIVSSVIQLPIFALAGWRIARQPGAVAPLIQATQAACAFVSTCLVGPLLTIALTLVYYDQRVRKEGFDLQLMMSKLQPNSQAAAATSNL
jgi:MFS family permease